MALEYDDVVYVSGLVSRSDLNNRAARVIAPIPVSGRYAVEFMIGGERVKIKPDNIAVIHSAADLSAQPFCGMDDKEIQDVKCFFWANQDTVKVAPGVRLCTTRRIDPQERDAARLRGLNLAREQRGLPVREYGSNKDAFWKDIHAMANEAGGSVFPGDGSTGPLVRGPGAMVFGELTDSERSILRDGGYNA